MMTRVDEELDSERLLCAARTDGRIGIDRLLHHLRPRVLRWARVLTKDHDRAEDLTQESLMRIEGALPEFSGNRLLPWAHRIVVNLHRDRARTEQRRARLLESSVASDSAPAPTLLADPLETVQLFLHELADKQRAVFQLVDLEGWETDEVAASLEIAPSTVRVHLMRARRILRRRILEEWIG